jgi:hypothetical protein
MITITDIFGNKDLDNDTAFIMVLGNDLSSYLTIKDKNTKESSKSVIYQPNFKSMISVFAELGLNMEKFVSASDTLVYNNEIPTKLLFINTDLVKFPSDYISVELYNNGTIWEPVGIPGYKSIGLIYEKGNKKPRLSAIPMLPIDLLIKIKNGPITGLHSISEFKNLSNDIHGYYNIDRSKITNDSNDYFKLLTYDGKYLTRANNKFAIHDKNKLRSPNQIFKHTINGDLIINDKCLTNKNNIPEFDNCKDNKDNKWNIIDNKIISKKNNYCLTLEENNNISLKKCERNDNYQQFTKETPNRKLDLVNDFNWKNSKGKSVVLTYNDNPWFLNKDIVKAYPDVTTFKAHINNGLLYEKLKGITNNSLNGTYGTISTAKTCKLNPDKNNCIIEKFEGDNNSMYTIIVIIIAILLVYFVYKKKHLFFKRE